MYMSYVRQSASCFCVLMLCLYSIKCETPKKNCSTGPPIYEGNSKKCLVDVRSMDFYDVTYENTSTGKTRIHRRKTDAQMQEKLNPLHTNVTSNVTQWELPLTENISMRIGKLDRETLTFQLTHSHLDPEARKKKSNFQDVIPYLIIPGFIMAGVVPWLIPGIKLAVMAVGMVNQMAFTSSLFTLIRGYIFDTTQEEHLVYINNGYKNHNHMKQSHKYL